MKNKVRYTMQLYFFIFFVLISDLVYAEPDRLNIIIAARNGKQVISNDDPYNDFKFQFEDSLEHISHILGYNVYSYLDNLKCINPEDDKPIPSDPKKKLRYWKDSKALEIITGYIASDTVVAGETKLGIQSKVYIGELAGGLNKQELRVAKYFNPMSLVEEFRAHRAITLYALAMDAKTNDTFDSARNDRIVSGLLSHALNCIIDADKKDIIDKKCMEEGELGLLKKTIDSELKTITSKYKNGFENDK